MPNLLIADIGGTKIAAALADLDGGVKHQLQVKSAVRDPESMFESLCMSFYELLNQEGASPRDIKVIGLGVPGKVNPEKGIAIYQNNLPWRNFPLASRLKEVFPKAEVIMDNDVYLAAYGEWQARNLNEETFVYFTVSTGISSCIIHKGEFIRGAGMAGEVGLTILENDQSIRTLESLASGPAIEAEARRLLKDPVITTKQLMDSQDSQSVSLIQKSAKHIAQGLHQIFSIVDPHVIVMGGGVIHNQPAFLELIQAELKALVQNPVHEGIFDRIQMSKHKGEAGLQGALYLALMHNRKNTIA
ncbi:glucokinase [Bacillus pakistanensis]|uniref:Glucokinase n=1 Tax=Rossellomorea pakistanensis TaxID=992288 RepID=A0ABS2NDM6_9BACI|nr:ROK family protein [Bacillus pakistanensis]MBM7585961.1 glucokinase [Bacillus pakistanensis]